MFTRISSQFSPSDFERIRNAVTAAEQRTSGEIVPYIVEQSDEYDVAIWRAGMLFGFLAMALLAMLRTGSAIWLPVGFTGAVLAGLLTGVAAMFCAMLSPPVKRWFAGNEMIDRRVAQRAAEAFLSEEVFSTRERTGILIFVSLLERRVCVLGDSGISGKVGQTEWDAIRDHAVGLFRQNRAADGLVDAVRLSADLLVAHGFARKPDDRNELSDRVRREEP